MIKLTPCVHHHKDGSIRARGMMLSDQMAGYWEFFRLDGTLMRSGHFDHGAQVGAWTTCNRAGKPHKVTHFPESNPDATHSTRTR
jgi:hypothetical protein